jgi:hypothetical protein
MIGEVGPILQEWMATEPSSVACVWQTDPTYLIFADDPERPLFVVHIGPCERLERLFENLGKLHELLPDQVPGPRGFKRLRDGRAALIEDGLEGVPISRLLGELRDRSRWESLCGRAQATLDGLRSAVARAAEWNVTVAPGEELRSALRSCREHGVPLSPRVAERARSWSSQLDELGELPSVAQHGDFGLGNLLLGGSGVGIIDFDEFGDTAMPLHDSLNLAFSIAESKRTILRSDSLRSDIAECLEANPAIGALSERFLPGMLLHFLLWQILQSGDRRRSLVVELLAYAERLAEAPETFLQRGFSKA